MLTPVADGRAAELRDHLRSLPQGQGSPLGRVEGTHFARWQVVRLEGSDGEELDTLPPLLVFASEHDGTADEYVARLCESLDRDAHAIWAHCDGYPGEAPGALERYLLDHRVRPGYSVVAYPGVTVAEVRASLALRDRLDEFAVRTRGLDPAALQRAWLQQFRRERR